MSRVLSFQYGISSRVSPAASMDEMRAMGNPVALDARAEERDARVDFYDDDPPGFRIMGELHRSPPMTWMAPRTIS